MLTNLLLIDTAREMIVISQGLDQMATLALSIYITNVQPDGKGHWHTSLPKEHVMLLNIFTTHLLSAIRNTDSPTSRFDYCRVEAFKQHLLEGSTEAREGTPGPSPHNTH